MPEKAAWVAQHKREKYITSNDLLLQARVGRVYNLLLTLSGDKKCLWKTPKTDRSQDREEWEKTSGEPRPKTSETPGLVRNTNQSGLSPAVAAALGLVRITSGSLVKNDRWPELPRLWGSAVI